MFAQSVSVGRLALAVLLGVAFFTFLAAPPQAQAQISVIDN